MKTAIHLVNSLEGQWASLCKPTETLTENAIYTFQHHKATCNRCLKHSTHESSQRPLGGAVETDRADSTE